MWLMWQKAKRLSLFISLVSRGATRQRDKHTVQQQWNTSAVCDAVQTQAQRHKATWPKQKQNKIILK